MKYKVKQIIEYYDDDNSIEIGEITRIVDGKYCVKEGYHIRTVEEKNVIGTFRDISAYLFWPAFIIIGGLLGFGIFKVMTMEANLPKITPWDKCVRQAEGVFDNFNDTVGGSYGHADNPSKEIQNFIDQCLRENK